VIAELESLIAEHPLREGLVEQLMSALYAGGRQAEALQAYQEARSRLVEALGIEPDPRLQELQRQILRQEAGVGVAATNGGADLEGEIAKALLAGRVVPVLGRVLAGLGGMPDTRAEFTLNLFLQTPSTFGQMSPTLMAFGLLLLLGLVPSMLWLLRLNRRYRLSDSWGCGRVGQTARMEYTAAAFAEPLKRVFAEIYRPMKELTVDFHPGSKYFVQSIEYRNEITPWFDQSLYRPFLQSATFVAQQVRRLQAGSLHLYLLYIAIVLTVLLVVARWF
jgi:hypothetical protein